MQLPLDLNLIQHVLNSSTVTGDLNNLTQSGFYYVQEPINAPTTSWPHVIVTSNDDHSKVFQLCSPDGTDEGVWFRKLSAGIWSAWQKLDRTADVTQALTTANEAKETADAVALDLSKIGQLVKIPQSTWVPGSGISLSTDEYFRQLTLINLGDNALLYFDQRITTTAPIGKGWNSLLSFPTSYLEPYQGSGQTIPITFTSTDSLRAGTIGLDKDTGQTNIYVSTEIPTNTTISMSGLILISKNTNLLNS